MKIRGLIFAFFVMFGLFFASNAKADIEAIQAAITLLGDVYEGAQEQIIKAKSLIESAKQLGTQVKKFKKDAEDTINQAKGAVEKVQSEVKTVQEKVQNIKDKAIGLADAAKKGDLNGLKSQASSMEFASLNNVFDGTKADDEMAEAVLDNMVRKKGDNSIENQKAISDAINMKNGIDMANMFGKTLVLRQQLRNEKDDFQNPESIDEAINLFQEKQISAMKRRREILNMESTIARFHHTRALQSVEGEYAEDKNE
ncbi:MAG TPA: hypothetical protein DIC64_03295 [Alphaproteobacteria bacterium]|nr:hypothetical protein [Alphaproteobacteria bacterium]